MDTTHYLAIDPGITGAWAWYTPDTGALVTESMPTQWRIVNKKRRTQVDLLALMPRLWDGHEEVEAGALTVAIEEPHGMPGAGAVSQFNFGATCGALWLMADLLAAQRTPGGRAVRLNPSVWKRAMGCPSDKRRALALARELFPAHREQFATLKDEGRAEAALMAYYVAHRRGRVC